MKVDHEKNNQSILYIQVSSSCLSTSRVVNVLAHWFEDGILQYNTEENDR